MRKAHTIGYVFCDKCRTLKLHEKGNIIEDGKVVGIFTECLKCGKTKDVEGAKWPDTQKQ